MGSRGTAGARRGEGGEEEIFVIENSAKLAEVKTIESFANANLLI
jgi:hypothetical protein